MSSKSIKWLHLSDFHVGSDNYAQNQLFIAIIRHVKEQAKIGLIPDFIFITGDLANHGLAKEYEKFNKEFLEPLQAAIGNKIDERTFAVPGNHDVDRRRNPGFSADKFLNGNSSYFDASAEGLEQRKPILERFRPFFEYDQTQNLGEWIMSSDGAFSFKSIVNDIKIGIVGINTAWLSEKEKEEKMLSPGKYLVENSLNKIDDCSLKIVLGHHPTSWFADDHKKPIEALFGKNNVIYLHGHLHEVWGVPQDGSGQAFLSIQSGAAFQAREGSIYKNGILWGEVNYDDDTLRLQPWTWNNNHQEWSLNSEAFPNSNRKADFWYFTIPGKKKISFGSNTILRPKQKLTGVPLGWTIKDSQDLQNFVNSLPNDVAVRYFDGAIPDWLIALSSSVPRRRIVQRLVSHFVDIQTDGTSLVVLLLGAGCEGKSTALLQAAYDIVKNSSDWRILRRTVETQNLIPIELISILNIDYNWLIVIDEADNAADDIVDLVSKLPLANRGKIHFLIAARDSDWFSSNASSVIWSGCLFKEERVNGLDQYDAELIVQCWRNYGEKGMGNLYQVPTQEQVSYLTEASKRDRILRGSAFFGALLTVRFGNDLSKHAKQMLQRLLKREIPSGGNLLTAVAYIAAMDAIGLGFLSRSVLAQALNCPEKHLRRSVLVPLGEEAAATITSDFIFTRHPLIAKVLLEVLVYDFGVDEDELYISLVEAALHLRVIQQQNVLQLAGWRYELTDYFFDNGKKNLALLLAKKIHRFEPENGGSMTKLAILYRRLDQAEDACIMYRESISGIKVFSNRRVIEDWAISERANKNYVNAAALSAFGVCDQASATPVAITGMVEVLQCISYCYKHFYFLYLDDISKIIAYSASALGVALDDDFQEREQLLKNIEEINAISPINTYSIEQFCDALSLSMESIESYVDAEEVSQYIYSKNSISFNSFKDILSRATRNK